MDCSQKFDYDVYETDSSEGSNESSECSEEEGYEKQFVINQGMMYMTSCNINQDIIPLVLQGTVDGSQQCVCHVGSEKNTGTINLNGVYDIYCDFFSYLLKASDPSSFETSVGSIFVINIDELNCSNHNPLLSSAGKGLIQCPTKLLVPIITISGTSNTNTINTDTLYITSILPTKISKLTLTFSIIRMSPAPAMDVSISTGDTFMLKLIFKKTENSHMSSLLNKQQKTKTLF